MSAEPRALTAAQNALVAKAAPMIEKVIRRLASKFPRGMAEGDMRGHASQGLVDAARSFDPSFGVPFEGFAWTRVEGAVLDAMRSEDRHRRLELTVRAASRRRLASVSDPSSLSDTDQDTVKQIDRLLAGQVAVMMQAVATEAERSGEEGLVEREAYAVAILALRRARTRLNERDRQLIDLHYSDKMDLKQVATAMNVSYATVRRYHDGVLDRLAVALRAEQVVAAPGPVPGT